ncbi:hypothetical protein CpipJ_CPIJ011759 [Culex quinquefasciatus]|uniref:Uncharacterized protein n=1 Tax=Culex quinquefasciatus TaxID=7176 RepID=B0WX37_CULQU|nr:hypothetical protein CpipJ_CPIJ011759 [Culex quinquefasciatus]|eukprot:XP_001861959.1 hypothetical protein CpipJ_CPIJ011759 [Culex quinquefasciatus]
MTSLVSIQNPTSMVSARKLLKSYIICIVESCPCFNKHVLPPFVTLPAPGTHNVNTRPANRLAPLGWKSPINIMLWLLIKFGGPPQSGHPLGPHHPRTHTYDTPQQMPFDLLTSHTCTEERVCR